MSKFRAQVFHHHTFEVPFKYLSIHFIAAQCSRPGLLVYWLTAPTTNAMFRLVQTIAYIKLLKTDTYCTFLISPLSFSPLRHCLAFNLQLVGNADSIGFASDMLNLSKTFVTYFCYDNQSTFLVLSRTMCIPNICCAGPRSFMENDLPNTFLSSRSSLCLVRPLTCCQHIARESRSHLHHTSLQTVK